MVVTWSGAGAIHELAQEIADCRICRDCPRPGSTPLPHEPYPIAVLSDQAHVLIASQAPGMRAHKSGVPFDDASGVRLREWLGVDWDTFYNPRNFAILPMGFCFPGYDAHGSDMAPRRECAPAWRERALSLMPQVQLILTIGSYAQKWHFGNGAVRSMTETVADWRSILDASTSPKLLPLPHPSWRNSSWLKRNPFFERDLLPVLQSRIKLLIS